MTPLITKFKLPRNPYVLFLPFLLLYIVIVLFLQTNELLGDEGRYLMYAQNLLHGYYSGPDPYLACGPGYPMFLMPFVALHLPLEVIKLMNPVLYYLSVVFLFKALRKYTPFKIAMFTGLFWACYYNAYENLPLILTETFAVFLVAALMLCLVKVFDPTTRTKSKKYIFLAGFLFGYIALTKVIFGYVMIAMLISTVVLWLFKRKAENYKKSVTILVLALITAAPYLIYTYNLSGRIFYWSTVSGNNLYWMSSPYNNEYGSWLEDPKYGTPTLTSLPADSDIYAGGIFNFTNRNNYIHGYEDSIKVNHKKDYEEIYLYKSAIERDDAFRRIAINNIKSHPIRFIENWFSNIGRILFNYPYSYKLQSPGTLLRVPLTGIIAVSILFCLIPTLINWRKIEFAVRFMLLFVIIYLAGSTLGSAETRMFTIAVPMLLFWIIIVLKRTMTINFHFPNQTSKI